MTKVVKMTTLKAFMYQHYKIYSCFSLFFLVILVLTQLNITCNYNEFISSQTENKDTPRPLVIGGGGAGLAWTSSPVEKNQHGRINATAGPSNGLALYSGDYGAGMNFFLFSKLQCWQYKK